MRRLSDFDPPGSGDGAIPPAPFALSTASKGFSGVIVDWLQSSARDVPAFAALLDAVGAAPKFGGFALFFAYTALLGLPALILAVIVRRHFEKETPPSARKEGQ